MRGLVIQPMGLGDLEEVLGLEERVFPSPWTRGMFLAELEASGSRYLVCRLEGELVGYGGVRVFLDEAHLMNLAVREDLRRRGIGSFILARLIREAAVLGARLMTLEVRRSNFPAISLYEKFGFRVVGVRRGYYSDNGEDALVMEVEDIDAVCDRIPLRCWSRIQEVDK